MRGFVERLVVIARLLAVGFWRNYGLNLCRLKPVDHSRVGIVTFVRQQDIGLNLVDQNIGTVEVTGLPGRQMKPHRIAQSVAQRMDFGAQPSL